MTQKGAEDKLRLIGSPNAHAQVLKAQYIAPDDQGNWEVVFRPGFELCAQDYDRMAEHIEATPGVRIVERKTALTFALDCTGTHDPEEVLAKVARLLYVARRDHIVVTQHLHPQGLTATVRLLFRQRRTRGQLLDLAAEIASLNGVIEAESSDENEITFELNAHYASAHGVQIVTACIAKRVNAHILKIVDDDSLAQPTQSKWPIASVTPPTIPGVIPAPGLPPFPMADRHSDPSRTRRRALRMKRAGAIRIRIRR